MSSAEILSDGSVHWRCDFCGRTYISKESADTCCVGKIRLKQIEINGNFYYLSANHGVERKEYPCYKVI